MYHLLIAEDEHWIRSGTVEMIDRIGGDFKVTGEASNGIEAWNLIQELWPTVLITDIMMPKMVTDHYQYFSTGGENYCQSFDSWDFHRGQESNPWISRVTPPEAPETFYGQVCPQYEQNHTAFKQEEDYPGPKTMQAACKWLEDNRGPDRFFLMVEAFDPHEPFDCPQHYLELYNDAYDGPQSNWPNYGKVTEPPEAIEHVRKRYAADLTMIDAWLGRLLDVMDDQNL